MEHEDDDEDEDEDARSVHKKLDHYLVEQARHRNISSIAECRSHSADSGGLSMLNSSERPGSRLPKKTSPESTHASRLFPSSDNHLGSRPHLPDALDGQSEIGSIASRSGSRSGTRGLRI